MRFIEGFIGLGAAAFGVVASASLPAQLTLAAVVALSVISAVIDGRRS